MAVIEFVDDPPKTKIGLGRLIKYIQDPSKTLPHLMGGFNCDKNNVFEQFMLTKKLWEKENGRMGIHFVQSFEKFSVSPEEAFQIATELLERTKKFEGFEIAYTTQVNTDKIHTHFVINSVNAETGKKWQMSRQDMADIKTISDEICVEHGLNIIEKKEKSQKRDKTYQAKKHNSSWMRELVLAAFKCRRNSKSKEEFEKNMNELGYKINWNKIKEPNLFKMFYAVSKEALSKSTSKEMFIEKMGRLGYEVKWKDEESLGFKEKAYYATKESLRCAKGKKEFEIFMEQYGFKVNWNSSNLTIIGAENERQRVRSTSFVPKYEYTLDKILKTLEENSKSEAIFEPEKLSELYDYIKIKTPEGKVFVPRVGTKAEWLTDEKLLEVIEENRKNNIEGEVRSYEDIKKELTESGLYISISSRKGMFAHNIKGADFSKKKLEEVFKENIIKETDQIRKERFNAFLLFVNFFKENNPNEKYPIQKIGELSKQAKKEYFEEQKKGKGFYVGG